MDTQFAFDEMGMPLSGVWVPTPNFLGAGALLYAVAMMDGEWDGCWGRRCSDGAMNGSGKGVKFPDGQNVRAEG